MDFTGEIWVKSTRFHRWNPPDFKVKSPTLHSSNWRVFAETLAFIILGGFHRWNLGEIHQISQVKSTRFQGEIPHPAFIKLKSFCWNTCFYNFGWISQVISGWNRPDFTDFMKSAGFHLKSAGFHGFHEIFHGMWAFAWWSSIGLFFRKTNKLLSILPRLTYKIIAVNKIVIFVCVFITLYLIFLFDTSSVLHAVLQLYVCVENAAVDGSISWDSWGKLYSSSKYIDQHFLSNTLGFYRFSKLASASVLHVTCAMVCVNTSKTITTKKVCRVIIYMCHLRFSEIQAELTNLPNLPIA